jgi:hypothetical protein
MEDNLIQAYQQTLYRVDGFKQPIRIGMPCPEVDAFCMKAGVTEWAFITAWNPLSASLAHDENERRHNRLLSDVRGYKVWSGRGEDAEGIWPAEESVFVAGIPRKKAVALGRKYGQRAIVIGKVHKKTTLAITLFMEGNNRLLLGKKIILSKDVDDASMAREFLDSSSESNEIGVVPIAGFHSREERTTAHRLIEQKKPLILVSAKGLNQKKKPAMAEALKAGLLLMVTPFSSRHKKTSASSLRLRNRLMADLADGIR